MNLNPAPMPDPRKPTGGDLPWWAPIAGVAVSLACFLILLGVVAAVRAADWTDVPLLLFACTLAGCGLVDAADRRHRARPTERTPS